MGYSINDARKYLVYISLYLLLLKTIIADDYSIIVSTADRVDAQTSHPTYITIIGSKHTSQEIFLSSVFTRNSVAWIELKNKVNVGDICGIKLRLNGSDGWFAHEVAVINEDTRAAQIFLVNVDVDDDHDLEVLRTASVDGGWSCWSDWGTCYGTCDREGVKVRQRTCTDPVPVCGGAACNGFNNNTRVCWVPHCDHTHVANQTSTTAIPAKNGDTPQARKQCDEINTSYDNCIYTVLGTGLVTVALLTLAIGMLVVLARRMSSLQEPCKPTKKVSVASTMGVTNPIYSEPTDLEKQSN